MNDMLVENSWQARLLAEEKSKKEFTSIKEKYVINGEVRIAVGTLQEQAVKANTVGTGTPKRFCGMFAYIDLEKMDWRGFKEERFIGTIEN